MAVDKLLAKLPWASTSVVAGALVGHAPSLWVADGMFTDVKPPVAVAWNSGSLWLGLAHEFVVGIT
jgi:hypothetical protein